MRLDKLTTKFQEALAEAQSIASGRDHAYIEAIHVLYALLEQKDSGVTAILQRAGIKMVGLKNDLQNALDRLPTIEGATEVSLSRELTALLTLAEKDARKRGDQFLASELFLLALANDKGEAGRLLKTHGGSIKHIEQAVNDIRGGENVTNSDIESNRESLKKYTLDLTEMARIGKLDPVIGRDDEIRRVIQILQRRTKNNPVLIGEPGVGKTAIVGRFGATDYQW